MTVIKLTDLKAILLFLIKTILNAVVNILFKKTDSSQRVRGSDNIL